jgi:hypothetical protein
MKAKTLAELVNREEPAIALIRRWVDFAENHCEILPPSDAHEEVLLEVQLSTRSTLGAMAYETGGILVDHGWLRFLGSGHPKLNRTLADWNQGRNHGLYLVADDAVGGFFAINDGAFGSDMNLYFWPPDSLQWMSLGMGFTDFFVWSLTSRLAEFYQDLRWPTWKDDLANLSGDQCFNFVPFLWTTEGSVERSDRRPVAIAEAFDLKKRIISQLNQEQGH